MLPNMIISVFFYITGFGVLIRGELNVKITSRLPESLYVFKESEIKLKCESSDSEGRAVNVTWHYESYDSAAIRNSSSTSIITWSEGNKTISALTLNVGVRRGGTFYIYCTGNSADKHSKETFVFVAERSLPKISVKTPSTQTVSSETRHHLLHCEVSNNVIIDKLKIEWKFNETTFSEKSMEKVNEGELNYRLQCLTEKDLGEYTCVASTIMFDRKWQDLKVTRLTGKFKTETTAGGSGIKNLPSLCLYFVTILFSMWRTIV